MGNNKELIKRGILPEDRIPGMQWLYNSCFWNDLIYRLRRSPMWVDPEPQEYYNMALNVKFLFRELEFHEIYKAPESNRRLKEFVRQLNENPLTFQEQGLSLDPKKKKLTLAFCGDFGIITFARLANFLILSYALSDGNLIYINRDRGFNCEYI